MRTRFKASDIPEIYIYDAIEKARMPGRTSTLLPDIELELATYPPKVVRAKLKRMVIKGKLEGCWCGCRGDFYIL